MVSWKIMKMYRLLPYLMSLFLLAACSHEQPKVEEPLTNVEEVAPAPAPTPVAITRTVAVPPPEVAILVSSDIPAYREVADAISTKLGSRAHTWYLHSSSENGPKILADIAKSPHAQVVAIGLDAAVSARTLTDKQVVFCQV